MAIGKGCRLAFQREKHYNRKEIIWKKQGKWRLWGEPGASGTPEGEDRMEIRKLQYRSHRGGVYYTPENTMPAFRDALEKGFAQIETDPNFTRDGVVVLLHDDTLNRTCRMQDGSPLSKPVRLRDITYEELMAYDAGIAMGEEFRGTKVPKLDELLAAAEGRDTVISLDKKIEDEHLEKLFSVVEKYKTKVSFSCKDIARIQKIQARFPEALIDYDGNTTDEELEQVCKIVRPENLQVWLYMDRPNFSWLTDRVKASPVHCARVKKYARLCLGNVNNPYDMQEALSYEPDVIEI